MFDQPSAAFALISVAWLKLNIITTANRTLYLVDSAELLELNHAVCVLLLWRFLFLIIYCCFCVSLFEVRFVFFLLKYLKGEWPVGNSGVAMNSWIVSDHYTRTCPAVLPFLSFNYLFVLIFCLSSALLPHTVTPPPSRLVLLCIDPHHAGDCRQ